MTVAPYILGRKGPGAAGGSGDGGFDGEPVVTVTAGGDTTISGKVKPGAFGKFVYPVATLTAGRQYTFRYTPSFSRLSQQGKLAMVGFGLKNGNDFHIVGLRGDGSTGLNKYKVNGTPPNGWNKDSGHTTSDGGAAANGTQAGPNWIRLIVSADGATYTFLTSPDGVTWTSEYTASTPTPFSNASGVADFGIALWFNNADAGPFSIVIDNFTQVSPIAFSLVDTKTSAVGDPTFTGVLFGAADPLRYVFITFSAIQAVGTNQQIASVTIGGVTATRMHRAIAANSARNAEIWYAAVPTGTSGNVVVVSNFTRWSMAAYRIVNLSSLTPTSTGATTSSTAMSINVSDGGIILAVGVQRLVSALALSNLTEDYDVSAGTVHQGVHASLAPGSAQTVSIQLTPNSNSPAACAVSLL